ncbi:hypothetical protein [Mucilaginibacter sp.]|uniref:hypothetical protein n=1 Tax=Mucilaginibacter sp. TaxID=1882438 RepID=UPI0025E48DEF|nr:hypothetical protein [Mucilaginibacter sp.]
MLNALKNDNIVMDCFGLILVFCLLQFSIAALIKNKLTADQNQKDGFLFRLKAAKIPIIFLLLLIAAIYTVPLLGYILVSNSDSTLHRAIDEINARVLMVLVAALPPIFFNLLSYKKSYSQ